MKRYENLLKSNELQQVNRIVLKGRCKAITISSSTKKRHRKNIFQCWRTCRGCKGQRPLARGSNGGGAPFASVRAAVATAHGLLLLQNADFRKKFASPPERRFPEEICSVHPPSRPMRRSIWRPHSGAVPHPNHIAADTPAPNYWHRAKRVQRHDRGDSYAKEVLPTRHAARGDTYNMADVRILHLECTDIAIPDDKSVHQTHPCPTASAM